MTHLIALSASAETTRVEIVGDKEYLVVPTVMIVEGVLHSANAAEPELALAAEFGKFPGGWNGRPVLIDHPKIDGVPVSASSSLDIMANSIGLLFNTILDGNRLKSEAWIDLDKVNSVGGAAKEIIDQIQNGTMRELSTGLFAETEQQIGVWEGKEYSGIWRNVVPDHLAILSSGVGACSIADGCGALRSNCAGNSSCKCGGCVTDDKVKENEDKAAKKEEAKAQERSFYEKALSFLGLTPRSKLSDVDLRTAIETALKDALGDGEWWSYVTHVYKEHFVYYYRGEHYQRSFTYADNKVTLGDDVQRVIPQTQFVAAEEEQKMDKEKIVSDLIANEATSFTAEDAEWLKGLSEAQLEKLMPKAQAKKSDDTDEEQDEDNKMKDNTDEPKGNSAPKVLNMKDYIDSAPEEIREVLLDGVKLRNQKRRDLIEAIKSNSSNKFSDQDLGNMSLGFLENLAAVAAPANFSGRGAPRSPEPRNNEDMAPPAPPKVFESRSA